MKKLIGFKTNCLSSRLVMGDIIRKIKYRPIFVELNIDNTALEFDVIRANLFCYTYEEMFYILKFRYIDPDLNREKKLHFF